SGTIDLAPLVAVPGATLRFAPGTATPSIEPCFWFLGNIQEHREIITTNPQMTQISAEVFTRAGEPELHY
ncbi:MAG TPA: hypothetical protein VKJ65_10155, partial [Phycisphaerae bacterium]|nr:hypothetical protein [Phycisphaerae bacterium]